MKRLNSKPIATNFCCFGCQLLVLTRWHSISAFDFLAPSAPPPQKSENGALRCFCRLAPMTLVTPLSGSHAAAGCSSWRHAACRRRTGARLADRRQRLSPASHNSRRTATATRSTQWRTSRQRRRTRTRSVPAPASKHSPSGARERPPISRNATSPI